MGQEGQTNAYYKYEREEHPPQPHLFRYACNATPLVRYNNAACLFKVQVVIPVVPGTHIFYS